MKELRFDSLGLIVPVAVVDDGEIVSVQLLGFDRESNRECEGTQASRVGGIDGRGEGD